MIRYFIFPKHKTRRYNLTKSQKTSPPKNIDILLRHCRIRTYKAKSIIIHFGDYSSSLFYIVSGSVAAICEDSDGKDITLAYLNAGDFVGEMGLFEQSSRSARIRAKTKCELAEISYRKFFFSKREVPRAYLHRSSADFTQACKYITQSLRPSIFRGKGAHSKRTC